MTICFSNNQNIVNYWLHIFSRSLSISSAICISLCVFLLPNLDLFFGQWGTGTIWWHNWMDPRSQEIKACSSCYSCISFTTRRDLSRWLLSSTHNEHTRSKQWSPKSVKSWAGSLAWGRATQLPSTYIPRVIANSKIQMQKWMFVVYVTEFQFALLCSNNWPIQGHLLVQGSILAHIYFILSCLCIQLLCVLMGCLCKCDEKYSLQDHPCGRHWNRGI